MVGRAEIAGRGSYRTRHKPSGSSVREWQHDMSDETTKNEPEMRDEYDFSDGVRGKYLKRYQRGANVVVLAPDVAEDFPDSESVNEALRESETVT